MFDFPFAIAAILVDPEIAAWGFGREGLWHLAEPRQTLQS